MEKSMFGDYDLIPVMEERRLLPLIGFGLGYVMGLLTFVILVRRIMETVRR